MDHKKITNELLLRKVISFAKPFKRALIIVFLCTLGVASMDTVSNICLSLIFDLVQKHGTDKMYMMKSFYLLGFALILIFLRILIIGISQRVEVKKIDQLLPNYLNHESIAKFFSFSNGQHINEHSGVKQTIVNRGTTSIQNQISTFLYEFFPSVALLLVAITGLFYANVFVGLIFLVIGSLFFYMLYKYNQSVIPGVRKIRDRAQLNSRFVSELYRFVSLVKNESQENRSLSDLDELQDKQQTVFNDTWLPAIKSMQKIRSTSAILKYGALFLVVYFVFQQSMTIGTMFLVFTWSNTFVNSLWQLTNIHRKFLLDKVNIEKYLELLDIPSDIVMVDNPIAPSGFYGKIEFKNISFYYPKRIKSYEEVEIESDQHEPVIKNVSFVINPGEKIGVVGESGSGKSTIASLIKRNFDPQEGQVLIDGNDLRLLDLKLFLKKIGSVEQEVVLFDRSIRDNILFGLNGEAKNFSDENLHKIAKLTRIDAFFSRLEHGFDTLIGEKGVKLSGGERQRLGIARALAKDPSILIFDEATSALDSMSESIVQQSIDEACKGKTSIVIAHRLSTVKNCDKILVFRHGILLAQGSHEELLESCEYYSDLVHHQMISHQI